MRRRQCDDFSHRELTGRRVREVYLCKSRQVSRLVDICFGFSPLHSPPRTLYTHVHIVEILDWQIGRTHQNGRGSCSLGCLMYNVCLVYHPSGLQTQSAVSLCLIIGRSYRIQARPSQIPPAMSAHFFFLFPPLPLCPFGTQVTDTDHPVQGYPPFFFSKARGRRAGCNPFPGWGARWANPCA